MEKAGVDRNHLEFLKIEKVLLGKVKIPKIDTAEFKKALAAQQTFMLKKAYMDGLRAAGAVLSKNIHCFLEGHSDSNPSMKWTDKTLGHHCFGCMKAGHTFDLFDAIVVAYDLEGRDACQEARKIAVNLFVKDGGKVELKGYSANGLSKNSIYVPVTKEMYKVLRNPHYNPIEEDDLGIKYLKEMRGISLSTAKRLKVMTWDYQDNAYLVFPNDDGTCARRLFYQNDGKSMPNDLRKKWFNVAGQEMGLFNQRALLASRDAGKVIFVTESALDTLTVEDAGFYSTALNGIANRHKLSKLVFSDKHHHSYKIIGLLDNDEAGINKVKYFTNNKFFVPDFLQPGYAGNRFISRFKDINEAWVADSKETKAELAVIAEDAEAFYASGGLC